MKKIYTIILVFIAINIFAFEPHFMYDPAINNAGTEICFTYMQDLWKVSAAGGTAVRLTSTDGSESGPMFSNNGKFIAYDGNRDKLSGIYYIPASGGIAMLISDEGFNLVDWFSDNKHILVKKSNYAQKNAYYKMDLNGDYSVITKWGGEYSDLSPDDSKIIFSDRGMPFREKYTGSKNGDIWEYEIKTDKYTRLTETDLTERYPVYGNDNTTMYFAYSDGEVFQINSQIGIATDDRKQLTELSTWSARDLSISSNQIIAFENFDEIWTYNLATDKSSKLNVEIKEDLFANDTKWSEISNKAENFAVSDDGKLLVFAYKYDLFAMPEKGGDVIKITDNQQVVGDIEILNDNKTVLFTAFKDKSFRLFKFDIRKPEKISEVSWSNDKYIENIYRMGKKVGIEYSNNERRGMFAIADSSGKQYKIQVNKKFIFAESSMSDDETYLIFLERMQGINNSKIWIRNMDNGSTDLIYNSQNWINGIFWGKDNKSILFSESGKLKRLDLLAKKDFYDQKDNWSSILKDDDKKDKDSKKDKKSKNKDIVPIKIDLDGIDLRVTEISDEDGWNWISAVKNDSIFYYINSWDEKYNLRESSYSGKSDKKIFTFKKNPRDLAYNAKNNCFYYTNNGSMYKLDLGSKKSKLIKNKFNYSYDTEKLNKMLFDRVWCEFGRGFYDPEMQGVDWDKLYKKYSKYLENANNMQQFTSIVEEMIGEVNASHTGFYARRDGGYKTYSSARLGVEFDYDKKNNDGIKIKKVYRKSKLNQPFGIKAGDTLVQIDGEKVDGNITKLLSNKTGEKIKLEFKTSDGLKEVEMKGLSGYENYQMYYDNWVAERAAIVDELSDGKIGYLHIESMNWSSYNKFLQDLFAVNYEKDALIIDVRNNGGGNIHDMLIEVLTKKSYSLNSHRSYDASKYEGPAESWEKPIVLLINEDSFSDAEIFPNLFREMKLGTIIGMPTSGSVIGTNHYKFRDGSSMRMPGHGWYLKDGTNMEGNGAQPDIYITQTPKQKIADDDVQLKRAIEELLK